MSSSRRHASFFADDVKLISARANIGDLRRDLHHAWGWAPASNLPLTENKCDHISIGFDPTRPLTLSDNGISIKFLDSPKDLGVTIDSSFKPSLYCAQAF